MWPPMPGLFSFASLTIASAFQRTMLLIRRSISMVPGYRGCISAGIVFTYGVRDVTGRVTPKRCAEICSVWSSPEARSGPRLRVTSRRASTHSFVSTQSELSTPPGLS